MMTYSLERYSMKKDLRMRHSMTDLKVRYSGKRYLVKKNSGMRKTEDENREVLQEPA